MRYQIVAGFTLVELQDTVNKLLKEGWKLQGGISIFGESSLQAMTLEEKDCLHPVVIQDGEEFVKPDDEEPYYNIHSHCPTCGEKFTKWKPLGE